MANGGRTVPETTSKYTVGNIVAVFACMVVMVGMALWAYFGDHSPRFDGSFWVILFSVFAVALGWTAIKAVRSRRR
jgi:hypothetical protein